MAGVVLRQAYFENGVLFNSGTTGGRWRLSALPEYMLDLRSDSRNLFNWTLRPLPHTVWVRGGDT